MRTMQCVLLLRNIYIYNFTAHYTTLHYVQKQRIDMRPNIQEGYSFFLFILFSEDLTPNSLQLTHAIVTNPHHIYTHLYKNNFACIIEIKNYVLSLYIE